MAHDKQYKDNSLFLINGMMRGRFDYPKKGESYWNRYICRIEEADKDLAEKFIVMEKRI